MNSAAPPLPPLPGDLAHHLRREIGEGQPERLLLAGAEIGARQAQQVVPVGEAPRDRRGGLLEGMTHPGEERARADQAIFERIRPERGLQRSEPFQHHAALLLAPWRQPLQPEQRPSRFAVHGIGTRSIDQRIPELDFTLFGDSDGCVRPNLLEQRTFRPFEAVVRRNRSFERKRG